MADAGPKLLRGLLEVFILESLEQSPKHGYALLKEMTEAFGAEPNRNRLYPLLGRLVRDGYVREVSESGGNRTLYALTDGGREALHAYRRLPSAFRHALRRIWSVETSAAADAEAARVHAVPVVARAPPTADAPPASATTARPAPRDDDAPPYPCPDARVQLEREPGGDEIVVRLTGCPMGAYDYCPQCPIHQSFAGVRRLLLG